jgi:hypothetical protein
LSFTSLFREISSPKKPNRHRAPEQEPQHDNRCERTIAKALHRSTSPADTTGVSKRNPGPDTITSIAVAGRKSWPHRPRENEVVKDGGRCRRNRGRDLVGFVMLVHMHLRAISEFLRLRRTLFSSAQRRPARGRLISAGMREARARARRGFRAERVEFVLTTAKFF